MLDLKILIYGDCANDRVSQSIAYFNLLFPYGDVTLMTAFNKSDQFLEADVLVIPGGADVEPSRYNETPHFMTGRSNPHYEYLDTYFLPKWIETGKPIIGICRGMQSLNVAMGGTLFQHIKGHVGHPDRREDRHHDIFTEIYDPAKGIDFRVYPTNSYHHQCVKKIADDFEMIAWSHTIMHCPTTHKMYDGQRNLAQRWKKKEAGKKLLVRDDANYYAIPEIIKHKTLPYIAFQYHPENMNCSLFHFLVEPMLSAVAK